MLEFFIKNLVFFGLTAIASLVFKFIISKAKFKAKRDTDILKYPMAYRLAPLCFVGYFAVIATAVIILGLENWPYMAVSGVVAIGGIVLMVVWSLWRVEIKADCFICRKMFIKRTYEFSQVELKEPSNGKYCFYIGEEMVFCVPLFIQNRNKLKKTYENYIKRN